MLETLAEIDRSVFYWINQGQRNPLFDTLMPFITGSGNWHIPILVAWTSLLLFGGGRGRTAALLVIPLITISDQTSSNFLKHAFERLRPCNTLPDVHLLVGCSGSFSMPSSHAANFGAAAIHFATFYPRLAPAFVTFWPSASAPPSSCWDSAASSNAPPGAPRRSPRQPRPPRARLQVVLPRPDRSRGANCSPFAPVERQPLVRK
jgi:undecaprenyl-diphosphatase